MKAQRKTLSNVGVRRQRALQDVNGDDADLKKYQNSKESLWEDGGTRESDQQQQIRLKMEQMKRERLVRLRQGTKDVIHPDDRIEVDQPNSDKPFRHGFLPPSSGSDSDSPPELFINPDYDLLPVNKTPEARQSFDFYVNSFATSIIEVSPSAAGPYSNIVHQILHDELLFTAFTTCSEAARWRTISLYDDPPLSVVKGYGKTITLLTKKLQQERFAMSPTVLLTMGQLVAIETMIKNVSATARHLAGMQAAMKPKKETVAADGPGPVQAAVDIWTQYFMFRTMVTKTIPKRDPLTYPEHPFAPDLSMQIAELPEGFADIALSGRLSLQVIDLLGRFKRYFDVINETDPESMATPAESQKTIVEQIAYCIEYHQIRTLTLIERLIVTTLTAYAVRRDRVHPSLVNMRNYYQITCAYFSNLLSRPNGGLHRQDQGSDMVTWAGLVLLLTSTPEAYARKLALRLLPKRPQPLKMHKKVQNFFWDSALSDALLSGKVLSATASNDIIADHVKQALPDAEREAPEDT